MKYRDEKMSPGGLIPPTRDQTCGGGQSRALGVGTSPSSWSGNLACSASDGDFRLYQAGGARRNLG
jgi:hypothetical protein